MNKFIFAGGRDFTSEEIAVKILNYLLDNKVIPEQYSLIGISGCAPGADTVFSEILKSNECQVVPYPAEWENLVETKDNPVKIAVNRYGKQYNKLAGFNRNTKMANEAEGLVAVFNGSSGTRDMIKQMQDLSKPVFIFDYEGNHLNE